MLITNFASGELSENLFGRTDLRQYYNAAAKMENFDVIPTGGIKKRGGTELFANLRFHLSSKIIPFVVDRNHAFLLYLVPGGIYSFRFDSGFHAGSNDNPVGVKVYETPEHIREVQYAQNFDTMILCHENYRPLEVKFENGDLTIRILPLDFEAPLVKGENITPEDIANLDEEKAEKIDKQYTKNGWLTTDGNYPAAVSFFNGRLIFAGTKNNRQRIFASAVKDGDKPYNFSTSKLFLTEKKEYSVLFGQIDYEDTSLIKANKDHIVNSFTKPQNKYRIDSTLYDKNTVIEYIDIYKVKLTRGVIDPVGIVDIEGIKTVLDLKITTYDNYDLNATPVEVFKRETKYRYRDYSLNGSDYFCTYQGWVKCTVKGSSITIAYFVKRVGYVSKDKADYPFGQDGSNVNVTVIVPDDVVKIINDDTASVTERISKEITTKINEVNNSNPKDKLLNPINDSANYDRYTSTEEKNRIINNCINELYAHVKATMYYELETKYKVEKFHNYPDQNYAEVMDRIENSNKTYIPFYTREILSDSYPTPDCGFTFEIASDMNDSIRWLAVNKGLIVGTETAEWVVPPGVHATNIQAALNSRYGSDKIQGTAIGDATIFFQAGKKRLVEYYIPQADNNFRANDMAMLSSQMLDESPAVEFDFASSPHTKLLITRKDGTMAALLYERSTGTFAWNRITLGGGGLSDGGKIRSAAVLPGPDGNDDVYLVVQRPEKDFPDLCRLEKLREDGDVYLDGYAAVNAGNWANMKASYTAGGLVPQVSRIYQEPNKLTGEMETRYETLGVDAEPDWAKGGRFYIGYPYESVLRTMPVLANDKMKKQRIVALLFRFLKSHGGMKMAALAGGRKIQTDPLTGIKPPHSGIYKQTFPGTWDEEVQAELTADEAAPVKILALNAEMAAGAY